MSREGLAGPSLRDQLRGHHTRSVHSSCGLFQWHMSGRRVYCEKESDIAQ